MKLKNLTDDNKILLEYINAVIAEEEEQSGNNNQLYQTFIQPFVDVAQTAAYGIETLSAQVQTVVKGFLLGLPTLVVPWLEYDYETFREHEKAELDRIKAKYQKTLDANISAITSNDAFGLAFLLAPTTVMAGQLAVKTPEAALKVLELLSGGSELLAGIRQALGGVANVGFHDPGHHEQGAWTGGGYGGDFGGMYEARKGRPDNQRASQELMKLLKDKRFQEKIQKSKLAHQMRQDGVNILVNHVKKMMALKDYNQLRQTAKGDVGFGAIGQKLSQMNQSGQIPQQDNQIVTAAMVPEIKKAYKDFWVKQLQTLMTQFPEAKTELLDGIKAIQALPQ